MTSIKFEYNFNKDAYVYVSLVLFSTRFGIKKDKNLELIPQKIQKTIKNIYSKNKISHSKLLKLNYHPLLKPVKDYLDHKIIKLAVDENKKTLETEWIKIEKKFFKKLSKTIKKPIYSEDYKCYLATLFYCPCYDEGDWFMVSAFSKLSNQIYVVCHEFMHLQFIHWYKDYCLEKGLTNKEFQDLKEAITFLLNEPEFSDIISFKDKGYPVHKRLRIELKKIWCKNKNFLIFLDNAIDYIKKNR